MLLYIDFETRSAVDLSVHGLSRYAQDKSTDVNCMAYAIDDGPVHVWLRGSPPPALPQDAIIVAHNAQFELAIWNNVMVKRYGWAPLHVSRVVCTMARCYAMALPGALENAAPALGLTVKKDMEGNALMRHMMKPREDSSYIGDAASLERLGQYCAQDVIVEREIYKRTLALTPNELKIWQLDQKINFTGVPFDVEAVRGALDVVELERERINTRMAEVTHGKVTAATNVGAIKEWAQDYGVFADSLAKYFLDELLKIASLPAPVARALELRREASSLTSIAKVHAIIDREILGRVQYLFQYHAATTGRFAGRGVQPHNFTRDLPDPATVEAVMAALVKRDPDVIDIFGPVTKMISRCLRGFIKAPEGYELLAGDYSAIEGRGAAWLAGEQWKLDAFRECDNDPSLPDLYCRTAGRILGVDPLQVNRQQRQILGKVPELAFGYQGGVGAFHSMGKNFGVHVSDKEADAYKLAWRDVHPRFEAMWRSYQDNAIAAASNPITCTTNYVSFKRRGSFLFARLPSGRVLTYPYPEVRQGDRGPYLTYKTVPDAVKWGAYTKAKEEGRQNPTNIVDDPGNCKQWTRIKTYGGSLTENITQAICRDILTDAMLALDAAGMNIVLHVHDEIVVQGTADRFDDFKRIMTQQPAWCPGFPIAAKCWHANRYKKDD